MLLSYGLIFSLICLLIFSVGFLFFSPMAFESGMVLPIPPGIWMVLEAFLMVLVVPSGRISVSFFFSVLFLVSFVVGEPINLWLFPALSGI